jgi:ComF family protein
MIRLLARLKGIIFPQNYTCDICGREVFDGKNLCEECAQTITYNNKNCCPLCGRKVNVAELCLECKAQAPLYKKAVSAMVYRDGAIPLILKFKNGDGYLKEYFADLLAPKCKVFDDVDIICCVPMTKAEFKVRGYNQSELLAKALSARLDIKYVPALAKKRDTAEQKTLTKKLREKNLTGCFKGDKKLICGKVVLLVDDIMTTGATADAVCTALLNAGAKHVYFATIASVEYKRLL